VVLTDAEDIEADLVGQLDLLQQVANSRSRAKLAPAGWIQSGFGEGEDS
jgi:hypothetical protein